MQAGTCRHLFSVPVNGTEVVTVEMNIYTLLEFFAVKIHICTYWSYLVIYTHLYTGFCLLYKGYKYAWRYIYSWTHLFLLAQTVPLYLCEYTQTEHGVSLSSLHFLLHPNGDHFLLPMSTTEMQSKIKWIPLCRSLAETVSGWLEFGFVSVHSDEVSVSSGWVAQPISEGLKVIDKIKEIKEIKGCISMLAKSQWWCKCRKIILKCFNLFIYLFLFFCTCLFDNVV